MVSNTTIAYDVPITLGEIADAMGREEEVFLCAVKTGEGKVSIHMAAEDEADAALFARALLGMIQNVEAEKG